MDIVTRDDEKARTFIIRENITSESITGLEVELMNFYHEDARDIIVDINEVTRIDSLTLAVFLKIKNMLAEKGRKFKLIHPGDSVRRIIEIASLETFLLEDGK